MSDFKTNLVQSADAAARVGVLFVAVAMFAAIWESDSPPTDTSNDHWLARRAAGSTSIADVNDQSPGSSGSVTVEDVTGKQPMSRLQPVSLYSGNSRAYPMPAGMCPGEYRVVDSFGMTDMLQVTAETVPTHESDKGSDQYIIEDGDRKIFFIRIHGNGATADLPNKIPGILR